MHECTSSLSGTSLPPSRSINALRSECGARLATLVKASARQAVRARTLQTPVVGICLPPTIQAGKEALRAGLTQEVAMAACRKPPSAVYPPSISRRRTGSTM
ncbi:MAG: hypothetical protein WA123_09030, partial [Methylotenera sp.]